MHSSFKKMQNHISPIAIIGGGPVGLAAAAHLTQKPFPFIEKSFCKGISLQK